MVFRDNNHQEFYEENIRATKSETEPYYKALFYALGLTNDTRKHINDLYDFQERGIIPEGLKWPWQTGTSTWVTRLAFNFFNDCIVEGDDARNFTLSNLFCDGLMFFMFEQ